MARYDGLGMPATTRGDEHGTKGWVWAMKSFILAGMCRLPTCRCNNSPAADKQDTYGGGLLRLEGHYFLELERIL